MRKRRIYFHVNGLPLKAEVFVVLARDNWWVSPKNRLEKPPDCTFLSGEIRIKGGEAFKFVVLGLSEEEAREIYNNPSNAYLFGYHRTSWFGWGTAYVHTDPPRTESRKAWWVADHFNYPVFRSGSPYEHNVVWGRR